MIILIDIDDIKHHNIYLGSRVLNKIKNMKWFQRIGYSTEHFDMNGLYINVPITAHLYKTRMEQLISIEYAILSRVNIDNLLPCYYIKENIERRNCRKFNDMVLKISGIWENNTNYGLIFKLK